MVVFVWLGNISREEKYKSKVPINYNKKGKEGFGILVKRVKQEPVNNFVLLFGNWEEMKSYTKKKLNKTHEGTDTLVL